jgi:hypothetical protein
MGGADGGSAPPDHAGAIDVAARLGTGLVGDPAQAAIGAPALRLGRHKAGISLLQGLL